MQAPAFVFGACAAPFLGGRLPSGAVGAGFSAVPAAPRRRPAPCRVPHRTPVCAAKKKKKPAKGKKAPKPANSGKATTPAAPASPASPAAPTRAAAAPPGAAGGASPFAGMAAGPATAGGGGGSVLKAKGKGGVLGKAARPGPPEIPKKTAADFIAEGVVDDVDDDLQAFEEADIRFGIDDVKDPFKKQLGAEAAEAEGGELGGESERKRKGGEGQDGLEEGDEAAMAIDITGDGGVLKTVLEPGKGEVVAPGAEVTVEYTGRLEDGKEFDSSRKRSGGFSFVLGEGKVIKGWEAGVATMLVGEKAELVCAPSYAYGRRGMPPVIPGSATLTFEVEVTGAKGSQGMRGLMDVPEFNPDVARTPEDISRDYEKRLETQAERKAKMTLLDRFYIISPFASQTGERPPWYLNPLITFFIVFGLVAISFYAVVASDGIHIGYVKGPVDVNPFN